MTLGECLLALDKAAWEFQQLARNDDPAEQLWNQEDWFRAASILIIATAPGHDRAQARHYLKQQNPIADNLFAAIATDVLDDLGVDNWERAVAPFVYSAQVYAKHGHGHGTDFTADVSGILACHCGLTASEFFDVIDIWRGSTKPVEAVVVSIEDGPGWIMSLELELQRMKLP
jgi:hypothetical protein